MAVIGIELPGDELVLTRRRDFKWTFENLDDSKPPQPVPFPAGDLFLELETGGEHNALQEVRVEAASGGTYKLGVLGELTAPIDYYDNTENPHGMDGDIQDALEALSTVGAGNVDVHPAKLYPVWQIVLDLKQGVNEIQRVVFTGDPSGGKFELSHKLNYTDPIEFGAAPATVQSALEALPSIGAGNVIVRNITDGYEFEFVGTLSNTNVGQVMPHAFGFSSSFEWFQLTGGIFPSMNSSTVVEGSAEFTEKLVSVLNKSINDFFNSFDSMLGVDIDYVTNTRAKMTLKVTSLKSFVEADLVTFAMDVTGESVEGFLNSVSALVGLFETIQVDFFWNHVYQVEFIGDLAETPIPKMSTDTTDLTGLFGEQAVNVTVMEPGKAPLTVWQFVINGSEASIKVESEECDKIANHTDWQLYFLLDGEEAGGDPIALGRVRVQGEK